MLALRESNTELATGKTAFSDYSIRISLLFGRFAALRIYITHDDTSQSVGIF
jgi:hypothetical protein